MSKQSQTQHREEAREERAAAAAEKLHAAEAAAADQEVVGHAAVAVSTAEGSDNLKEAREMLLRHGMGADMVDALEAFIRAVK